MIAPPTTVVWVQWEAPSQLGFREQENRERERERESAREWDERILREERVTSESTVSGGDVGLDG